MFLVHGTYRALCFSEKGVISSAKSAQPQEEGKAKNAPVNFGV